MIQAMFRNAAAVAEKRAESAKPSSQKVDPKPKPKPKAKSTPKPMDAPVFPPGPPVPLAVSAVVEVSDESQPGAAGSDGGMANKSPGDYDDYWQDEPIGDQMLALMDQILQMPEGASNDAMDRVVSKGLTQDMLKVEKPKVGEPKVEKPKEADGSNHEDQGADSADVRPDSNEHLAMLKKVFDDPPQRQ